MGFQALGRELGVRSGASRGMVMVVVTGLDATAVDQFIFVADRPYRLQRVDRVFDVVGGSGAAFDVKKHSPGTAVGAGTSMFLTPFGLISGARAQGGALPVEAESELPAGWSLGLDFSGTLTGLAGLCICLNLLPLTDEHVHKYSY